MTNSSDVQLGEVEMAPKPGIAGWLLPAGAPEFDEAGRLLLPLRENDFEAYATPFTFNDRSFSPKAEFHVTLIGTELATRIAATLGARGALEQFLESRPSLCDWAYSIECGYMLIGKEFPIEDLSIIVPVSVRNAESLYAALDDALGLVVERPPLHVTLYTYGDPRGIAISSMTSLASRLRADLGENHPASGCVDWSNKHVVR